MKLVYSWLKDMVDIDVPVSELADALTGAGLEVASITHVRVPANIRVAKILETAKHPDADRLSVCTVDAGTGEHLQIVCGATNSRPGMLSALAVIGADLGGGFVVKKTKLRGVDSFGMLCSERELGLSEEHAGIVDLPADYEVGAELSRYYPEDAVIEIEITPDRGDCLSVVGVAREVAARFNLPLKDAALRPDDKNEDPVSAAISVVNDAPDSCPRYAGRLVRNVKIGPSPEWLARRLALSGLRPINNIVDITNYMLLQYGQPMHAFDYDRIGGRKIVVKKAGAAGKFTTLDGVERSLVAGDLLISDGKGGVALAGIMGGAGSEISDETKNVFFECAFFTPSGIRATSKRLCLSTDSSYRFERGVDPEGGLLDALDSAAALAARLGGGKVSAGMVDLYPAPQQPRTVIVRASRASRVLGVPLSRDRIAGYLFPLGIACEAKGEDVLSCVVPSFRHDLLAEEDLIEEVGRCYGYDAIPASQTATVPLHQVAVHAESRADDLRGALAHAGFNEIMTNSLTSEKRRALLTPGVRAVGLLNPLSPDMALMRTSLSCTMLDVLVYNHNRKNRYAKLFEIGRRFEAGSGERIERDVMGILIDGDWIPASWNTAALPCDVYVLKGLLEVVGAGIGRVTFEPVESEPAPYEKGAMKLAIGETIAGTMGELTSKVCGALGIRTRVFFAELDITDYLQGEPVTPRYVPLPKYPALERDFCFVMPEELSAADIAGEIHRLSTLVEEIRPFDLYRGEKLGAGLKSIAFGVRFRSLEKTLTDGEADVVSKSIIAAMEKKFSVRLRT